jgi:hypothetical protein
MINVVELTGAIEAIVIIHDEGRHQPLTTDTKTKTDCETNVPKVPGR